MVRTSISDSFRAFGACGLPYIELTVEDMIEGPAIRTTVHVKDPIQVAWEKGMRWLSEEEIGEYT